MICNRFPSSDLRPSVSAEAPPRQDAVTGCHPFHGFQLPFLFLRGVPHSTLLRGVLHRLAMGMSPVSRALNAARLRSPTARQIPIYRAPYSNFGTRVLQIPVTTFCY